MPPPHTILMMKSQIIMLQHPLLSPQPLPQPLPPNRPPPHEPLPPQQNKRMSIIQIQEFPLPPPKLNNPPLQPLLQPPQPSLQPHAVADKSLIW